jgi:uncharacterized Zn finger protein
MPSVADLVEAASFEELAGADERAAGWELADRGAVRLVAFEPIRVTAEVADGEPWPRVELATSGDQLDWSCSCHAGPPVGACRHVVAAGLEAWRRAPGRRS